MNVVKKLGKFLARPVGYFLGIAVIVWLVIYKVHWLNWGMDMNLLLIKGITAYIPGGYGGYIEFGTRKFFGADSVLLFTEISLALEMIWRGLVYLITRRRNR